jgi:hypothetical protein
MVRTYRLDDTTLPNHPGVHVNHKPFHKPQGPMKHLRKNLMAAFKKASPTMRVASAIGRTPMARVSPTLRAARALRRNGGVIGTAMRFMNPERSNRVGYVGQAALKSRR